MRLGYRARHHRDRWVANAVLCTLLRSIFVDGEAPGHSIEMQREQPHCLQEQEGRLGIVERLLSVTSDTPSLKRLKHGYKVTEHIANVSSDPDTVHLVVNGVGHWTGAVDIAEYVMLSWPEYNDDLVSFDTREIIGVDCISADILDVTTRNVLNDVKGNKVEQVANEQIAFAPNSELFLNWTAAVPEMSLEDHYFDPRMLCDTAVLRCPSDLYPFDSLLDCYEQMSRRPQLCEAGQDNENGETSEINGFLQGDTISCRFVHLIGASLRPTVHCSHMAATSQKCTQEACPGSKLLERSQFPLDRSVFAASAPYWFRILEMACFILSILQFAVTSFWYFRARKWVSPTLVTRNKQHLDIARSNSQDFRGAQLPVLEFKNMIFKWNKEKNNAPVVRHGRFYLGGHKVTALVAPTGAGKTTFLKILCGFDLQYMDLSFDQVISRPPTIICQQLADMWPEEMKVKDIILFSCTMFGSSIEDFTHCLSELGVLALLEQTFSDLSGGQRQLVNIASAIVQPEPTLIFLDEPMASLDEETFLRLHSILKKIPLDHAFVVTVHMITDAVYGEFDRIVPFRLGEPDHESPPSQTDEAEPWAGHVELDGDSTDRNATVAAKLKIVPKNKICDTLRGIRAILVLWHSQFFGWPITEAVLFFASICGGLSVGSFARGSFVSQDMDYIPTETAVRLPLYYACSIMGLTMITSFGVPLVFGVREKKLISDLITQKALSANSYIVVVVLRSIFLSCIQSLGWYATIIPLIGLANSSFDQILVNAAIFGAAWTLLCSAVVLVAPPPYASHAVLILNVFSLLFSGIVFIWDDMHPVLKLVHYFNPVFYFVANGGYLLLSEVDTMCDKLAGIVLHPGRCASAGRAFEMSGLRQITTLEAQGVAFGFIVLALAVFWIRLKGSFRLVCVDWVVGSSNKHKSFGSNMLTASVESKSNMLTASMGSDMSTAGERSSLQPSAWLRLEPSSSSVPAVSKSVSVHKGCFAIAAREENELEVDVVE